MYPSLWLLVPGLSSQFFPLFPLQPASEISTGQWQLREMATRFCKCREPLQFIDNPVTATYYGHACPQTECNEYIECFVMINSEVGAENFNSLGYRQKWPTTVNSELLANYQASFSVSSEHQNEKSLAVSWRRLDLGLPFFFFLVRTLSSPRNFFLCPWP